MTAVSCQELEQQAFALAALCQEARAKHSDSEAAELECKLDLLLIELNRRCRL